MRRSPQKEPDRTEPSAGASKSIAFPEELPISAHVREIAMAIDQNQVVIVAGETGSGKTTQLPKIALAMGRGLSARIGVTQPRRIAATSVAARVATELGVELGKEVGYQIRFANRVGPQTYVKFMTDGILLAEIQGDPDLRAYDTLIIDEAHERSLNIDFLLGYLKRLLPRRPDLRVIVSSATLETSRFAAFYGGAPVIGVSGRTYPVETIYRAPREDEVDLSDAIANTVEEITELDPREDILVFLPGEREIRDAADALEAHALPHTTVLPLYGRLTPAEQSRVFTRGRERRIVLATNVAETSLTIPGIVYVIDAGLARINRYQARSGVTQLHIEPISRASADQRKGRAGRTRSGVCFRLYEQADYESRPAYTDPELSRVGLAGAILQMKAIGLGDVREFPFLDPPPKRAIDEGYRVLEELGAVDKEGELTPVGQKLARLPADPRIGRMILGGVEEGALPEALVIAAALGIQDPRERPLAAQKQADQAHRRFANDRSDFLGLLTLWRFYQDERKKRSKAALRKVCRDHFLSFVRMSEWADVHDQLESLMSDVRGAAPKTGGPASPEAIHRAIIPGLLSRIGIWHPESRTYIGARQTRFVLHPSSALAKKPPNWVVVAELVETSQLFGRTAAGIDPTWLESLAGPLVKRTYGDPFFSEKTAQVMAKEQLSLYGLPIVKDRKVHYGPIDPKGARRLFLIHALVRGEYAPPKEPPFAINNRKVFEEVRRLRDRARRSDMVAEDEALAVFFEQRVPDHVFSGRTFEVWREEAEKQNPRLLFLSLDDVLVGEDADIGTARFPESLEIAGAKIPLTYKFDPSADDDGITLEAPLVLLPQLDPTVLEWTIPGWHAEKIALLLYGLPKSIQRSADIRRESVEEIAKALVPFRGAMLEALSDALYQVSGVRIAAGAFRPDELPPYLRFNVRVMEGDKVVATGRDLADLKERLGPRARDAFRAIPKGRIEKTGLAMYPAEGLPAHVVLECDGSRLHGYPALVETDTGVDLRVLESRGAADEATRRGLRRLLLIGLGATLQTLEKQVPARVASSALSDRGSPRVSIAARAIDEAFVLADPTKFPRTALDFRDRLESGKHRLAQALAELGRFATDIAVELDAARAQLKALVGKPGAPKSALDDIRLQLDYLVPADLFTSTPRSRLRAIATYLRAIRVRLERLPNGPQKDQSKADVVLPFWKNWLEHHRTLERRGVPMEEIEAFRFMVEELRVATFAPEVGPTAPISKERLSEAWTRLKERAV